MVLVTAVFSEAIMLALLDAGAALVVWAIATGTEEWLPHTVLKLSVGRRLVIADDLAARHVEVVRAIPASFCTTAYAVAQALRPLAASP